MNSPWLSRRDGEARRGIDGGFFGVVHNLVSEDRRASTQSRESSGPLADPAVTAIRLHGSESRH